MKIRMKTTLAGPEMTAMPGTIQEFSDKIALDLIRGGYADLIEEPVVPETAMISPPEKAVKQKPKPRRVKK